MCCHNEPGAGVHCQSEAYQDLGQASSQAWLGNESGLIPPRETWPHSQVMRGRIILRRLLGS